MLNSYTPSLILANALGEKVQKKTENQNKKDGPTHAGKTLVSGH
jgi:hypothetical protein